jgi:hypothetical protein
MWFFEVEFSKEIIGIHSSLIEISDSWIFELNKEPAVINKIKYPPNTKK